MRKIYVLLTIFILFSNVFGQEDKHSGSAVLQLRMSENTNTAFISDESESTLTGFDFGIHYFPGTFTVRGASKNLGSELFLYSDDQWVDENGLPDDVFFNIRSDYGDEITPIITNPGAQIPFIIDLGYTHRDTRFGFSWFRVSASWKDSGSVPGYYQYSDDTSEGLGYGLVNFWNMGWDLHASRGFPAVWIEGFRDLDEDEEGDFDITFFPDKGNTRWTVNSDNSMNSFRFTIKHPIVSREEIEVRIIGGVHYGRWKDNLGQKLNITSHQSLTEKWSERIEIEEGDSIDAVLYLTSEFNNDITLETNSRVSFDPFGAVAGLEAGWSLTPSLHLSLSAFGSAISGETVFSGRGIDIDDIVERATIRIYDESNVLIGTGSAYGYEYLSGQFDLPETVTTISTFNYGIDITAGYKITDIFSVTAGYYHNVWRGLPMAPQWTYSDQYTDPYGAFAVEESWNTDIRSDISNSGFRIGVRMGF